MAEGKEKRHDQGDWHWPGHIQCTAKSKQNDRQCRRPAVLGGVICTMHGGKAPQTAASARKRLGYLVDPAIDVLHENLLPLEGAESDDPALQVKVSGMVLDRTGHHAKQGVVEEVGDLVGIDPDDLSVETIEMIERDYKHAQKKRRAESTEGVKGKKKAKKGKDKG